MEGNTHRSIAGRFRPNNVTTLFHFHVVLPEHVPPAATNNVFKLGRQNIPSTLLLKQQRLLQVRLINLLRLQEQRILFRPRDRCRRRLHKPRPIRTRSRGRIRRHHARGWRHSAHRARSVPSTTTGNRPQNRHDKSCCRRHMPSTASAVLTIHHHGDNPEGPRNR